MNSERMKDCPMNDELWSRVEEALDARFDPLSIPSIAEELSRDPAARRAVTQLVDRLALLTDRADAESAPAQRRRRRASSSLVAAAALVLFAGLASQLWLRPDDRGARLSPRHATHVSTRRTVDTITLTVEHTSPPPARGASVDLSSPPVILWTLEGDSQ